MLGFKRFDTASVTIRGIELAEKIKKQQFNLRPLTGKPNTAPEMWAVVLAAGSLENHSPNKNIHLIKFAPEPAKPLIVLKENAANCRRPVRA